MTNPPACANPSMRTLDGSVGNPGVVRQAVEAACDLDRHAQREIVGDPEVEFDLELVGQFQGQKPSLLFLGFGGDGAGMEVQQAVARHADEVAAERGVATPVVGDMVLGSADKKQGQVVEPRRLGAGDLQPEKGNEARFGQAAHAEGYGTFLFVGADPVKWSHKIG